MEFQVSFPVKMLFQMQIFTVNFNDLKSNASLFEIKNLYIPDGVGFHNSKNLLFSVF